MIFHYCKEGDSVLSVAREYGVSPVRLIEENALGDPDRLAVGQCLAIYKSSRSYTVRGGDTFEGIRRRFGIGERELLKFNPGIGDKRLLYPGQTLSLGRAESSFGPLTACGFTSKNISVSKLRHFSSALTYLVIIDSDLSYRSGCGSQKERELIDFSVQNGILPLLSVQPFGDPKRLADGLLKTGYRGVYFHDSTGHVKLTPYAEAVKEAGHIVLLPDSENLEKASCDWILVPFGDHRRSASERFSAFDENAENAYRTMLELPYSAIEIRTDDGHCIKAMPLADCTRLAYRKNAPIEAEPNGKSRFDFTVTVSGKHERRRILFDDIAEIKKGLSLLGEFGISGISYYPEWCPHSLPTLLHHCFDVIKV